jgi:hypothetical protein
MVKRVGVSQPPNSLRKLDVTGCVTQSTGVVGNRGVRNCGWSCRTFGRNGSCFGGIFGMFSGLSTFVGGRIQGSAIVLSRIGRFGISCDHGRRHDVTDGTWYTAAKWSCGAIQPNDS